jgi:4-carboxymuconolactone decarboxylase
MPRIPPVRTENMTPDQKRVHDMIASGPRGSVRGPLAVWLHRPGLAEPAQALGRYCRYESSLPPRLSEWAILILARIWSSHYEWFAHKPIGIKAGLSPALVDALRDGGDLSAANAEEKLVHAFLTELHASRRVSQPLYDQAVRAFGEAGVIDLVGIAGYYTLISMTLNVFEVPLPEGEVSELK